MTHYINIFDEHYLTKRLVNYISKLFKTILPNTYYLVFLLYFSSVIVGAIEGEPIIVYLTIILLFVGFFIIENGYGNSIDSQYLHAIFVWGFFIRILYSFALYYWLLSSRGDPYLGGGDDRQYDMDGQLLFEGFIKNHYDIFNNYTNHPGYPFLNGILHYIGWMFGGYHLLVPRIFNAFIGSLIAPYVYILSRNIYDRYIAILSAVIVMLFPYFVFYSSIQLRDIIIVFLFVFCVAQLSQHVRFGKYLSILKIVISVIILTLFRSAYGLALIFILLICLLAFVFFDKSKTRAYRLQKIIIISFLVLISISYIVYINGSLNDLMFGEMKQDGFADDKISRMREASIYTGSNSSSLGSSLLKKSYGGAEYILIPAIALIMPYPPWDSLFNPGPLMFIDFINNLSWTLLMPLTFIGLFKLFRINIPKNLFLIVPLIVILTFSSTIGFELRYRLAAYPFAIIIATIGFISVFHKKEFLGVKGYMFIQFFLLSVYSFMKYIGGV